MQPRVTPSALVFGGTGAVGAAVLHGLRKANVPTTFGWHRSKERAQALAKELGSRGVRINVVTLGLLEGGLAREVDPKMQADFKNFSALRRLGKPDEAAKAILWLALENTYINGRALPVNGGI